MTGAPAARTAPCADLAALLGPAAAALLAKVRADPSPTTRARLVGVGGTGKSALAARLRAVLEDGGATALPLSAVASAEEARGSAVVVDDAHLLTDAELALVGDIATDPLCGLLIAHRPVPRASAPGRVIEALGPHAVVEVEHLTRGAAARRAEAIAGFALSPALTAAIHHRTAGLLRLVDLLVRSLPEAALRSEHLPAAIPVDVHTAVATTIVQMDEDATTAILALRFGAPADPHTLAQVLDAPPQRAQVVLAGLAASGVLVDDRVVPLVSDVVLSGVSVGRKGAIQRALLAVCLEPADGDVELARRLSAAGLRNEGLATVLRRAGDRALRGDPASAVALYRAAVDAGAVGIAAAQAEAAYRAGDPAGALSLADHAMSAAEDEAPNRAVIVAAAVLQQRGLSPAAAQLYQWLGPGRVGAHGPAAALTLFGVGLAEEASEMLAVTGAEPPTVRSSAERLLAEGIRDSMSGHTASALGSMTSAVSMVESLGASPIAGDSPAAMTALLALNCGEFATAQSVLEQAIQAKVGGATAAVRHQLILAWTAMLQGREPVARELLAGVGEAQTPLAGRDDFVASALRLALARRAGDTAGMMSAWPAAHQAILRHQIDLYSLLPLGELMVAAARLNETHRVGPALASALAMTQRVGRPTAWAAMLHWGGVQTAVLDDRRTDLAFHVEALAAGARLSQFEATLSVAAQAWASMLAGQIDAVAIAAAARRLSAAGLIWDASRLAGQGAARTTDRKAMTELMQCARELQQVRPPAETMPRIPSARAALPEEHNAGTLEPVSRLSRREQQVASMVLEGRTYREIAEDLFISVRTVEHHVARMRRRVGASNRSDLFSLLRTELSASDPQEREQ